VVAREAAALVLVSVVVGAKAASVAAALDDSALSRREKIAPQKGQ
jgi:hypothetical protein